MTARVCLVISVAHRSHVTNSFIWPNPQLLASCCLFPLRTRGLSSHCSPFRHLRVTTRSAAATVQSDSLTAEPGCGHSASNRKRTRRPDAILARTMRAINLSGRTVINEAICMGGVRCPTKSYLGYKSPRPGRTTASHIYSERMLSLLCADAVIRQVPIV